MAKRAYGSGSKREVRPGVWQLRVGGASSTFRGTGKQAEAELGRLIVANAGVRSPVKVPTLRQLLDTWLAGARLEQSTRATYGHVLAHLPDKVAKLPIDRLTLRTFDELYAELERQGVGAATVRKLHTILSAALSKAMRWQMIAAHPARGAQLPRVVAKPRRMLSAEQLAAVLAEAQRSLDGEAFVRLAIATGGRRGELIALRWDDVDLDAGTITISRALRTDGTAKGTKTDTVRTLPIDAGTVDVLRRWRKAQLERALHVGTGVVTNGFVLSHAPDCSQPWAPLSTSRRWVRLAERAGVTGVNLHALRHTHVSMLIRAGVDVATVSARAGHSRPTTTLDMYTHVIDDGRHAADIIGAILDNAQRHAR